MSILRSLEYIRYTLSKALPIAHPKTIFVTLFMKLKELLTLTSDAEKFVDWDSTQRRPFVKRQPPFIKKSIGFLTDSWCSF